LVDTQLRCTRPTTSSCTRIRSGLTRRCPGSAACPGQVLPDDRGNHLCPPHRSSSWQARGSGFLHPHLPRPDGQHDPASSRRGGGVGCDCQWRRALPDPDTIRGDPLLSPAAFLPERIWKARNQPIAEDHLRDSRGTPLSFAMWAVMTRPWGVREGQCTAVHPAFSSSQANATKWLLSWAKRVFSIMLRHLQPIPCQYAVPA
jgi:hypothetical protein